jgi:hypothetical protein
VLKVRQIAKDKQRHKRLRLLLKALNKKRKKQAKQIDILCNDLISAHRDFIEKLDLISFTAGFYELIMGINDIRTLLCNAGKLIGQKVEDTNIAFFLRQYGNFELHVFESDKPITLEKQELEACFGPELVSGICAMNKVCTLDEMFAMGLQGNPTKLNTISAATIPLGQAGTSFGFILVYRPSQRQFKAQELAIISAVSPGLSRAIWVSQQAQHSLD